MKIPTYIIGIQELVLTLKKNTIFIYEFREYIRQNEGKNFYLNVALQR